MQMWQLTVVICLQLMCKAEHMMATTALTSDKSVLRAFADSVNISFEMFHAKDVAAVCTDRSVCGLKTVIFIRSALSCLVLVP